MNYRLQISAFAAEDLVNACRYYDCLREGLGDELEEEWTAICERVLKQPEAFSYFKPPFRQATLNRFPYQVIYEIIGDVIQVTSFFNARQDPSNKFSGLKF